MHEARGRHLLPDQLLASLSEFLAERIGLHFPKERWRDLERGMNAAARELDCEDTEACIRWLVSSPLTRRQVEILASHLTVGETYFFRDAESLRLLEQHVLPGLIGSRAGRERRLRIWSAGCCSGEEPYSIAMVLARTMPDLRDWNVSILATDINPRFLSKASLGVYGEWSFRDTPPGARELFFTPTAEGRFQIDPRIRAMVTFAYLNLAEDVYPSVENNTNAMDIIFCRNVLMYFEPARSRMVLRNLGLALVENGWLFVNPVEMSQLDAPRLAAIHFPGAIAYRRTGRPANPERVAVARPAWVPTEIHMPAPEPGRGQEAGAASRAVLEEPTVPAQTPYEQASALYAQGRYAEAVQGLRGALSQEPGDAAAMALLAKAYANLGYLAEALIWSEKAVAAEKLNPGWHYLLAAILQERGQADEAAGALRRALYLDQDHALAHFALGNLIRRQGRVSDSERHFRTALSILSRYPQEQILPESEMTAGRLAEIIQSTVSGEAGA